MSKSATETKLEEQAEAAFAAGDLAEALRVYTALADADPGDAYAWYRTAAILGRMGNKDRATADLDNVSRVLAANGQLLAAIVAAKDLADLDDTAAKACVAAIAGLYGTASDRARRDHRSAPPPVPAREIKLPEASDVRVAKLAAEEACDKAAAHWAAHPPAADAPLPHHALLSDLAADDFAALIPVMETRVVAAGEKVIEEGSPGTTLFMVVRGTLEVSAGGTPLTFLRSGAFFGEMALLTDSPRAATVAAQTPSVLLALKRETLGQLAEANPNVATVLAAHTRARLLRRLMATSPLFAPLDEDRRAALIDLFTSQLFDEGGVVIEKGAISPGLFVILSGSVSVSVDDDDGEALQVAMLGPGQVVGEISLIQQKAAGATVKAAAKTVVLTLSRDRFNDSVGDFPEVLAHIYKLAVDRDKANKEIAGAAPVTVEEDLLLI